MKLKGSALQRRQSDISFFIPGTSSHHIGISRWGDKIVHGKFPPDCRGSCNVTALLRNACNVPEPKASRKYFSLEAGMLSRHDGFSRMWVRTLASAASVMRRDPGKDRSTCNLGFFCNIWQSTWRAIGKWAANQVISLGKSCDIAIPRNNVA